MVPEVVSLSGWRHGIRIERRVAFFPVAPLAWIYDAVHTLVLHPSCERLCRRITGQICVKNFGVVIGLAPGDGRLVLCLAFCVQEVLQRRRRLVGVSDPGLRPQDRRLINGAALPLAIFLKPVLRFRQQVERNRMMSEWVMKDLHFGGPWLISVWPKAAILVARYVEAEGYTFQRAGTPIEEFPHPRVAEAFWSTAAGNRDSIEFGNRTRVRKDDGGKLRVAIVCKKACRKLRRAKQGLGIHRHCLRPAIYVRHCRP